MSACRANSPECYERAHDPRRCSRPDERPLSAAEELRVLAHKMKAKAAKALIIHKNSAQFGLEVRVRTDAAARVWQLAADLVERSAVRLSRGKSK